MACAPSEDSDQHEHPSSLIRVFAMKKAWFLSYPLGAEWSLWSYYPDALANLSLRWAHIQFVNFVIRWLICVFVAWSWSSLYGVLQTTNSVFWKRRHSDLNPEYDIFKPHHGKRAVIGYAITKTCLYNFDPLKPHSYIVKLGFTGVYIIFLISAQKHRLWVLLRTASPRRF